MPTADASSVISIAISLGVQIDLGDSGSTAAITKSGIATQTNAQLQTDIALATATISDVPALSTSIDCSGAISGALAAAGLPGAGDLTGTSAATAIGIFS